MRIISTIGRFISGLLASASGIVTLLFNDVSYAIFNGMSSTMQYICIAMLILLGIFLISSSICDIISIDRPHSHCFKYQSKKFKKFFSKWYSKPGTLSIICDDLDWVKTDNNSLIYNQLLNKSKEGKLRLYLGNGENSEMAQTMKKEGAQIFSAPGHIVEHYTFSCLSVMGNAASRVIVRNKQTDKKGIVIFDEINNTYITELLNALLSN